MSEFKNSEAKRAATRRYLNTLDKIQMWVPKPPEGETGLKDQIKAHAEKRGESVNAFLIRAATETMERDNLSSDQ